MPIESIMMRVFLVFERTVSLQLQNHPKTQEKKQNKKDLNTAAAPTALHLLSSYQSSVFC